ncbi:MAG: hypothetical protein JW828_15665 [Sedimentisphaerales bacterium]|nr:hypothetical protein [Sedimentisphaerales bacterium]
MPRPVFIFILFLICNGVHALGQTGHGVPSSPPKILGNVDTPKIKEISGFVASRRNPGILWVHNDSGDLPRVYALNKKGQHKATFVLRGASARDWEDMAIGPGPEQGVSYLYLGDIGDNNALWNTVAVYCVPEPAVDPNGPAVEKALDEVVSIRLKYPDGPRDAETLLVDPITKDLYLISKRDRRSRVYRGAYPYTTNAVHVMTFVGELPWAGSTGGDVCFDGRLVLVRNYAYAGLWIREIDKPLHEAFSRPPIRVPVPREPMGESIAFSNDGKAYLTVAEGLHRPLYLFPLPDELKGSGLLQ